MLWCVGVCDCVFLRFVYYCYVVVLGCFVLPLFVCVMGLCWFSFVGVWFVLLFVCCVGGLCLYYYY